MRRPYVGPVTLASHCPGSQMCMHRLCAAEDGCGDRDNHDHQDRAAQGFDGDGDDVSDDGIGDIPSTQWHDYVAQFNLDSKDIHAGWSSSSSPTSSASYQEQMMIIFFSSTTMSNCNECHNHGPVHSLELFVHENQGSLLEAILASSFGISYMFSACLGLGVQGLGYRIRLPVFHFWVHGKLEPSIRNEKQKSFVRRKNSRLRSFETTPYLPKTLNPNP